MSRSTIPYGLLATIGLLLVLVHSAVAQVSADNDFEIVLTSRTFSPPPGIDLTLAQQAEQVARSAERWHGLLQFESLPNAATRAAFEQQGGRFLGYLPHNTWLVSLPLGRASAVVELPQARWLGELLPQDKLAQGLLATAQSRSANESLRLLLHPHTDVPLDEAAQLVEAHGGTVLEQWKGLTAVLITISPENLTSLAAENSVLWLALAPEQPQPLNDGARSNSGADVAQAAPYNLNGHGVQVAVWDSGAIAHPDLLGRVALQTTLDTSQHATHVAGTLAGSGATSVQFGGSDRQWRGVAPQATLLSYDFMLPIDEFSDAIGRHGSDVLQNSWGFLTLCNDYGVYEGHAQMYDEIVAGKYAHQPSVVFAAGNSQSYCDSPYGTVLQGAQSAKNVITVGAIYSDDSSMTDFSSWGPTKDGRLKPEIVAAGDERGGDGGIWSTFSNDNYGALAGTSMAAPLVSGALALLYQQHQRICQPILYTPQPATMRALLLHTADDLVDPAAGMHQGPDFASGYGRLNIPRAADFVEHHWETELVHGEVDSYAVHLTQAGELKVTLAWDDLPAQLVGGQALVNDLDLRLIAPDGTDYGPWLLDPERPERAAVQATGTKRDKLNVIEQVVVQNAMVGEWRIEVRGTHLPSGKQRYTIINEELALKTCFLNDLNTTPLVEDGETAPTAITLLDSTQRLSVSLLPWLIVLGLLGMMSGRSLRVHLARVSRPIVDQKWDADQRPTEKGKLEK